MFLNVSFCIYTGAKSRSPPPSHTRTRDAYLSRAAPPPPETRNYKQGEIVRSGDFDDRLQSTRRGSPPPRGDSYRAIDPPPLRRTREADTDRDYPDNDPKRQRTGQFPDPEYMRRPARRELSRSPPRHGETDSLHSEDNNAREAYIPIFKLTSEANLGILKFLQGLGRKRVPLPPQSESYRGNRAMPPPPPPPPPPPSRHPAPSRVTPARDRPLPEDGMDHSIFDIVTNSPVSHVIS